MADRRVPALAEPRVAREDLPDGSFVLSSEIPLRPPARSLGAYVARWATARPDGVAFAEREGDGWRTLTWRDLETRTRAVAQAILQRDLSLDRPIAILSGNGLDHAILALAAARVGVPVVPVSVAYSLLSRDHVQLRHVFELTSPGLVFCAEGAPFAAAIEALELPPEVEVVTGDGAPAPRATPWRALLETRATADVDGAAAHVGPDTVAKIMMTSGSTDRPKGVLTTHGMLTVNQEALAQTWPFVEAAPPVLVDWLPWSHTFGGSHNFDLVLRNGGTMYIDAGRPAPHLFGATLENLRMVSPTVHFNVPAGYAMLVQALEADAELARAFFSRIDAVFYAAAALPQDTWDRLDRVAEHTLGHRVWLTTAWGSTETSPLATSAHFPLDHAGNIGVPVPGVSLRFVPAGDKLELRVKGPNVTPGYHRAPSRTRAAFDERGFYRIGDAGKLVDSARPAAGILFDGRAAEDFKLSSGTWVNVGEVRTGALSAAGGLLGHAVVAGHDQDFVGLLAWLAPGAASSPADPRAALVERLQAYNAAAGGSSRRIRRLLLLPSPPDLDAGEITDKGYVNAQAVLRHRATDVARLFAPTRHPDVIVIPDPR